MLWSNLTSECNNEISSLNRSALVLAVAASLYTLFQKIAACTFNLCYIIYHTLSLFTAINLECEAEFDDDPSLY